MQADAIAAAADPSSATAPSHAPGVPLWLKAIDRAVIVLLNVMLAVEVVLVFANTMLRWLFNTSLLMGADETSWVYLVFLSFLGGAVAYSHGQFLAITLLVDRLSAPWREFFAAATEWTVIFLAALIGIYSVPLLISNAEEKTILLGIGYAWVSVPITLGAALFVLHAGLSLLRRPMRAVLSAAAAMGAVLLLLALAKTGAWVHTNTLYLVLAGLFLGLLAIGVPIGFVLAAVGLGCVYLTDSASMVAVVMTAQRGSGGFILLALPFFILAGFITDRANIGGRLVEFVASMIGHLRGGLMHVMIVGVYISSGISGSKAADMATIGIPMRKMLTQRGYPAHEQAALLAAAAAMGESVPPSIAIILMGSVTSVSTGALFIAGFLPAAVVAACLMGLVYLRSRLAGWPAGPRVKRTEILRTGKRAILPLLMPVILIGGIIAGVGTPTEVSTFAVIYGFALGLIYRQFTRGTFWQVLTEATLLNGMIFFTVSVATVFSWSMTLQGMATAIAQAMGSLGPSAFLPGVIVITILVGALLESFVTIIILAPLLLPVALQLGINPLQYGIIMTEAFGIGSILPPIGIALYVACTICGARVERASTPLLWYLTVMIIGLLLVAYIPWITLSLPTLFNFKG